MSNSLNMSSSDPQVQAAPTAKPPSVSKVRASQKLTLKQKIKYWNMSMPQSQTSGSGTQHYKFREPAVAIDLTEPEQPSSTSIPGHARQSFNIGQKAKDKSNRLFDKFSGPMVPPSKPAGKQNWSWDSLDNDSKATLDQTQPSKTDLVSVKEESSTGVNSIFGPRKPAVGGGVDGQSLTTTQATAANNSDEAAFRDFTKLSKEIRDMIWKLSIPPPQAVVISKDFNEIRRICNAEPKKNIYAIYRAKATYKIPSLLHTCQESREVGLKRYSRAFKEQLGGRPALFDYKNDILFFDSYEALGNFYGGTLIGVSSASIGFHLDMNEVHRNVERVAIATKNGGREGGGGGLISFRGLGWTLNLFTNLKLVLIGDGDRATPLRTPMISCIEGRSLPRNLWSELVSLKSFNKPEVVFIKFAYPAHPLASTNTRSVRALLKQRGITW